MFFTSYLVLTVKTKAGTANIHFLYGVFQLMFTFMFQGELTCAKSVTIAYHEVVITYWVLGSF